MADARRYLLPLALALLVAASLWPSLWWVEISNESEQLVIGAAVESLREGSAQRTWRPSLNGEVRLKKPPLATWAAMAGSSVEEARRLAEGPLDEAGHRWMAVKMRTIALAVSVALLVLTFELGRLLGGRAVGLVALAALGASFGFIKYGTRQTTDLHLALWVTAANVGLAHAVLRRRWVGGLALAGAATGLALMSKGPVALVQTIPPVLAFVGLRRLALRGVLRRRGRTTRSSRRGARAARRGRIALGALSGLGLLLGLGLPWFVLAYLQEPAAAQQWGTEVSRSNATSVGPDSPTSYLILFALTLPWAIFFVIGLVGALHETARRAHPRFKGLPGAGRLRGPGVLLALCLLLAPILIMIWFPDRKERYLVPMLPPAAVLTAMGLLAVALVCVAAIGLPIAAMLLPRNRTDGDLAPWLAPGIAIPLAGLGLALAVGAILATRRFGTAGLVAGTVAATMFCANVYYAGYGRSYEGRSELKPLAVAVRAEFDDFRPIWSGDKGPQGDLTLYLGRPIPWAEDPTALPADGPPVVWFARREKRDPELSIPPGWRVLASTRRGSSTWYAIVRA